MNYRSVFDLHVALERALHLLPADIDLVVGLPRSGMMAASMAALITNRRMSDLDHYVEGRTYAAGRTKPQDGLRAFADVRRVLVIDDSVSTGASLIEAKERIDAAGHGHEVFYAAVFGSRTASEYHVCDHVCEVVGEPRVFQWNVMHHNVLARSCVDIDGVLCRDPERAQNDDGPAYRRFLREAAPLHRPSWRIGTLVTSRLERYRPETEEWLARHGIRYDRLDMLDLPSAEERRRRNAHAAFKAERYMASRAHLFIESEVGQAREIARLTGKPVLCMLTHTLFDKTNASDPWAGAMPRNVRSVRNRVLAITSRLAAKAFGPNGADAVHGARASLRTWRMRSRTAGTTKSRT